MQSTILEIMYVVGGVVAISAGVWALKDNNNPRRYGTALFWIFLGVIFVLGKFIPPFVVGIMLIAMACLTVTKQVKVTILADSSEEHKEKQSLRMGNKIWIPALSLGVIAMILAPNKQIGGLASLGFSSLIAFLLATFFTKDSPKKGYFYDAPRLLHLMGAAVILPQLLGSLGAIFSKVGVGEVVAQLMSGIIPEGDRFMGVALYCISMALFTSVMGNAFAAFAVITAGIGIPFVINQGGNPAIVGALGMTAGYCGTLMTPMAANFNIVPATIMTISDKYRVIKVQAPFAITLLMIHIIVMYLLAY